jgi:hypothetical protein
VCRVIIRAPITLRDTEYTGQGKPTSLTSEIESDLFWKQVKADGAADRSFNATSSPVP